MSSSLGGAVWLECVLVLAAGSAVLVGAAALLSGRTRSGVGLRALWQACTLGLALLVLAEATGAAGAVAGWVGGRLWSRAEAVPGPGRVAANPGGKRPGGGRAEVEVSRPADSGADPLAGAVPEESGGSEPESVPWPGVVWLAGAMLLLGRMLVGHALLLAFRRRHRALADGDLVERVRSVAARLGLRRRVRVLEAPGLCSPAAFGLLRPALAVPAGFARDFDAASQEAMLAHELAHLAGHDPAWHLLADLVAAALWWQPLVWWSRLRLRAAAELAADEASLVVADGPGVLAACLVRLGGRLAGPGPAGWVRMAGSGFRSGLGRRVERLLRLGGRAWRPGGLRVRLVRVLGAAALLALAVLSTAWARPRALHEGDEPMTMQSTWRRSLMGVVLMAALAPGDDGPRAGGSPAGPAGPGEIGPKAAGKKPRDAAELEKLRKQQREVVEELNRLLREAAKRFSPGLEDDPLQARIKELEAKKAKLEGELKDLLSRRYIKVFRLKHASPEQLKEALDNLLNEDSSGAQGGGPLPGGPGTGGPPGMTPPAVGRPGMGAGMRPPGGGFNFGPGGAPAWRVTVDDRTRSLIVRGNRDVLQTAADLVAVLDAPADKPLPRVQKVRAFRLRFARAEGLAEIIGDLGLRARLYPLPKSNMLLVSGSDAVLKEIGELIQELDVEGKGQPGKNKE